MSAIFTTSTDGAASSGVVGTGSLGVFIAVAIFVIVTWLSMSACSTVYFVYNVTTSPTSIFSIDVIGVVHASSLYTDNATVPLAIVMLSVTGTLVNVTFPVFVTTIV